MFQQQFDHPVGVKARARYRLAELIQRHQFARAPLQMRLRVGVALEDEGRFDQRCRHQQKDGPRNAAEGYVDNCDDHRKGQRDQFHENGIAERRAEQFVEFAPAQTHPFKDRPPEIVEGEPEQQGRGGGNCNGEIQIVWWK